jgi:O-antigen ligase
VRHLRGLSLLDGVLLLVGLTATWQKMSWNAVGRVTLVDLLQLLFIGLFVLDRIVRRDARLSAASSVVLGFVLLLLSVHLCGFLGLDTTQAVDQWTKGIIKWLIFATFLICAITHVARRGEWLWWRLAAAFTLGVTISAAYGLLQTAVRTTTGVELDALFLKPLFPGARALGANLYGVVSTYDQYGVTGQANVYRLTGFSEDPNHLGLMTVLPLLLLTSLIVGARDGFVARHRWLLSGLAGILLVALLLTQSRSALLGVGIGVLMLLAWYRRRFFNRQVVTALVVLGALGLVAGSVKTAQLRQVIESRIQTGDRSSQAHVEFYGLIVPVLEESPLFGVGVNNFAVYYEFQTGRADFGPHSFYVATLTEMGLVGAMVWLLFLLWVGSRLRVLLRAGRARSQLDADPMLSAVARGLAAGFVATLVGNIFYLTMIFSAFYLILLLIIAAPAAFGIERVLARRAAAARATPAT